MTTLRPGSRVPDLGAGPTRPEILWNGAPVARHERRDGRDHPHRGGARGDRARLVGAVAALPDGDAVPVAGVAPPAVAPFPPGGADDRRGLERRPAHWPGAVLPRGRCARTPGPAAR